MSKEIEKLLVRIRLTFASHISNINIKHDNLESRYVRLVKDVDKLEERVRVIEKDLGTVIEKSVKYTLAIIGSCIGIIYTIIQILEHL